MNKKLTKYLNTRATQGPWELTNPAHKNYRAAIIIPALAESESLPKTLAALASNPYEELRQTLLILVVNHRLTATEQEKSDNRQTLAWLLESPYPQLQLSWIDAASPGLELPEKEGVGLVRKIGFDLALSQLDWKQDPLLISLDADTLVDEQYLPAIYRHFAQSEVAGATIPFRHQPGATPEQEQAIRRYELYLRSYLFGLQQAGSPYAYHTIGSAFACRASAYLAVGGMNRRHAAEDFYFLQQLAKTSGVEMLTGTVVQPSPRFSARVPFGTGKAVQGQVEQQRQLFQFSSAAAFSVLRDWLKLAESSLQCAAEQILEKLESDLLRQFLAELDFVGNWARLQQNYPDLNKRKQAFHCWFDGLRTRQLLACLDRQQQQAAAELVMHLLAWGGYPGLSSEAEQLHRLEMLQGVEKQRALP